MSKIQIIMEIFNSGSFIEFTERFSSDEKCKEYLSELKWHSGFVCKKRDT